MANSKQRSTSTSSESSSASQRRNQVREQRQERVSASQNKQRQASPNRRKSRSSGGSWGLIIGVVLVIAAAIGVFIYLSQAGGSNTPAIKPTPVSPSLLNEVTNVSPSILAAVGTGGQQKALTPIKGPPLTGSTGRPEFFYAGAEYCPFCAAQRWAVVVALSRFGTFSNLSQTTSSSTDAYPSTPTFTFYQSVYTSQYIDFVSLEMQTNQPDGNGSYTVLQTPTADQNNLISTYDAPPYLQSAGSIPFIDIAGKYAMQGANYTPQVLSGLSWQNIADDLSNQNSDVTKGIVGSANYLIAAICNTTSQQSIKNVCTAAPIPTIESSIGVTAPNAHSNQLAVLTPYRDAVIRRLD
jgi:Domain of unknown function (DUF929)